MWNELGKPKPLEAAQLPPNLGSLPCLQLCTFPLSSHTIPVLSHYWAARLGGELRELKCRFIKTGSCQNATASTFFPNPTGEGWEVTPPFDLPVMAFARETGPHLAGSQTLSLTSTDRKQFKDKPSPCLNEAWLWCLPHCGEARTRFLRNDNPPRQQQPEAPPCCKYAATWPLDLHCLFYFPPPPWALPNYLLDGWTASKGKAGNK